MQRLFQIPPRHTCQAPPPANAFLTPRVSSRAWNRTQAPEAVLLCRRCWGRSCKPSSRRVFVSPRCTLGRTTSPSGGLASRLSILRFCCLGFYFRGVRIAGALTEPSYRLSSVRRNFFMDGFGAGASTANGRITRYAQLFPRSSRVVVRQYDT